jgi:hypothetical protein
MRSRKGIIIRIILGIVFFSGIHVSAQNSDCKVTLPNISGAYTGGCKKGLAQGKGIAQGVDRYEGQFNKGMPNGKGVYHWANGSVYEGQWLNGTRDGNGKMVFHLADRDSVVSGYWKNDKYIGEKYVPPYKIMRSMGVTRYSFIKISDEGSDVTFKIFLGGKINSEIEGFNMAYDSGSEFQLGSATGIQNVHFPLNVKITYRTWNLFHTAQSDIVFEFEIKDPGKWDLSITN